MRFGFTAPPRWPNAAALEERLPIQGIPFDSNATTKHCNCKFKNIRFCLKLESFPLEADRSKSPVDVVVE